MKQKLTALAAVAVVLVGGAVAAVTATGQARGHARGHATTRGVRGHSDSNLPAVRHNGSVAIAARYLNLSRAQLRSDLQAGRSLAQIANATSGKSATGLIDALVAAKREQLARRAASLPQQVSAEVGRAGGPAQGAHAARAHHHRHGHRAGRRVSGTSG